MILKYVQIFSIAFLFSLTIAWSAENVSIFHEYSQRDTIDMGMCLPGNELQTIFNIKNNGSNSLQMNSFAPCFAVFEIKPDHPGEQFEFLPASSFPLTIQPGKLEKLLFKFQASTSPSYPPRKNTARLLLGVFDPGKIALPGDTNDLEAFKQYIVIGRKTIHYIDVFENLINFDSIYVHPPDTLRQQLIVQNSSVNDLSIHDVKFVRSFNAEITPSFKNLPVSMPSYLNDGFQETWTISYYPRNIGLDTAMLSFYYKPEPVNYPDSVDIRKTIVHGIGVQQDLGIIASDSANFTFDSINFGDLDVGQSREVRFVVRTVGNLPFGALGQNILSIDSDKPADGFEIVRKMNQSKHLQPFTTDTLIIKFTPARSDTFNARFVIESDIYKRKIWGCPDSVRYRTLYLKGVGRQAEIANIPNVIDFGNIIVNEFGDCPTRRDSMIAISNVGNLELRVNSKVFPDINTNPFKVEPGYLVVPGRESRYIRIIFDSIANTPGDYEAELWVRSNSPSDKDTLITILRARGVYPDTMNMKFPALIISKPGRRISVPVLIDKNKISHARIYSDTISYNRSLLNFYGTNSAGTASALAEYIQAQQDAATGSLSISIKTVGSERFLRSDTLVLLEFDTYAGNALSTQVHFVNSKLGDGYCSRILSLTPFDGVVTLDSVCGLAVKTGLQIPQQFRLNSISPNPARLDISMNFDIAENIHVTINLYNSYGEITEKLFDGMLPAGSYSRTIELSKYPQGLYFIDMRSGIFSEMKSIIHTD